MSCKLNNVPPRKTLIGIPNERKSTEILNDKGEVIRVEPTPFNPFCRTVNDDGKKLSSCIGLTLNPDDAAGFAATSALMANSAQTKTSGLSDVGSDDADTMSIVSGVLNASNDEK